MLTDAYILVEITLVRCAGMLTDAYKYVRAQVTYTNKATHNFPLDVNENLSDLNRVSAVRLNAYSFVYSLL